MKKSLFFVTLLLGCAIFNAIAYAQGLYEAGKKEGKVVIYGQGGEEWAPIVKAFGKRYPGIQVEAQDMRGREAREKIIAEQGAKQFIADLVTSGEQTIAELRQGGFLEPYQSPQLKHVYKNFLDQLGFRNTYRVNVYGITINTRVVPPVDEPKLWKDLLNPKFRGKIACQDPRGSGGGFGILSVLSNLYGIEFIRDLAKQNIFFGARNSQLVTGLVRGEHGLMISSNWTDSAFQRARTRGGPVKFIKPQEGVRIVEISFVLVKNAPHANAAKLFIDWLLSEEAQKLITQTLEYTPARKDVGAKSPEADIQNTKILADIDWTMHPELIPVTTKQWEEIFFKK
ncbi:MAG: ABC transporter substrate-binding protein [Candidatus Binatia bacterium]